MPGSNLTRIAANTRAELISVHDYDVSLDITSAASDNADERVLHSRTQVRFSCMQPGAETYIDLVASRINEATLNGTPVDASGYDPKKGLVLSNLAAENTLIIDADCLFMNTGEGMHRFVDPADNNVYLYTQCEARDAHRIYACFDQPDLKGKFTFHITAPTDWRVFSNGIVTATDNHGPHQTLHFSQTVPLPTYITAVVAGPFEGVEDEHDGIPLGIWCRASMRPYLDADDILTVTKQGFDFFHEHFDYRYPFGKYDQIFVAEFNTGAMENAACVTHSDEYMLFRSKQTQLRYESRANTILHEMAHMWFGNLVTMKWWDDLWLNESFAEWASHWANVKATKYTEAWTSFATMRKAWGMRQDQMSSTHPVATDAPDVETAESNFDGITYAKGAAILKQLVTYVGEEQFVAALRDYFKARAFGNATLADLLGALEKASGRDLSTWAQAWLNTSNINTLRPLSTVDADSRYQEVHIEQTAPADYPTLRPHRIAVGLYDREESGAITLTQRIELDIENGASRTPIPQLTGTQQPALLLVNDQDLTYAKTRLDELSMKTAVADVARIADPLTRALCWGAAWDMNRDAELATRHYVTMAINGLPRETSLGVIQGQLGTVLAALDRYADPAWAPSGYSALADTAWQAAQGAEPGSDLQLVWVRTLANSARSPESLSLVSGLIEGSSDVVNKLPDLKLDPDLRWLLVQNYVAHGPLTSDQATALIDAESSADNTDLGARLAAMARAMIPSAAAKADAWRLAVESDTLPSQTSLAIMHGFGITAHAPLLGAYEDKYFDVLPEIWRSRTSEVAVNIADALYPSWNVSQEIVDRTDEYLANNPDLAGVMRRALAEGRDSLIRALKARECDKAAA